MLMNVRKTQTKQEFLKIPNASQTSLFNPEVKWQTLAFLSTCWNISLEFFHLSSGFLQPGWRFFQTSCHGDVTCNQKPGSGSCAQLSASLLDGIINGDGALACQRLPELPGLCCQMKPTESDMTSVQFLLQHCSRSWVNTVLKTVWGHSGQLVNTFLPQPVFVCPLGFNPTKSQCWTAQWMLVSSHSPAIWTTHSVVNICPSS